LHVRINAVCEMRRVAFVANVKCDSPGLSDTGGSQIMVANGGSKDEPDEG
jgi:hypothetical protein